MPRVELEFKANAEGTQQTKKIKLGWLGLTRVYQGFREVEFKVQSSGREEWNGTHSRMSSALVRFTPFCSGDLNRSFWKNAILASVAVGSLP